MPSAPPAPRAGSGQVAHPERGHGEAGRGTMLPVLRGVRGRPLMAARYGLVRPHPPRKAVMAPVEERPQELRMAEGEMSKDNRPLTDEEQYDLALENVALAFSEFLYWALQTHQMRNPAVARMLNNISHQLSDYEQDQQSNPDGADSSEEEFYD